MHNDLEQRTTRVRLSIFQQIQSFSPEEGWVIAPSDVHLRWFLQYRICTSRLFNLLYQNTDAYQEINDDVVIEELKRRVENNGETVDTLILKNYVENNDDLNLPAYINPSRYPAVFSLLKISRHTQASVAA